MLARFIAATLVAAAAVSGASSALAQAWPARSVSIIVPFPAGGGTDIVARLIAQRFTEEYKQPFVVENRAGASGNIGAGAVATAAPNGYTLLFSTSGPVATNVLLFKSMPFNPVNDLTPIGMVAEIPLVIVAGAKLPAKNIQELVAYEKANPGKLNFGNPGVGTMGHMAGTMLGKLSNIKFATIPYQGSAPATTALLAGEVDFTVDLLPSYLQHIKAGTLRALAVSTAQRLPSVPDVPTLAEQGVTGYEASSFVALFGPAKLPDEIVQKLNGSINAWLKTPDAAKELAGQSMTVVGGTPEANKARVQKEIEKWGPIVKEAGISLD